MSYEEDRLVLQEYEAWKELTENFGLVVTIERFLEDRQNVDNARRIEEALSIIPEYIDENGDGRVQILLRDVERILTGDRPYIIERSLSEAVGKRVFT